MGQRTPLYDLHVALGAKIVDFGGWDMPLHYGSQVEEHHQVRSDCGVFDVSHMTVIDIAGDDLLASAPRRYAGDQCTLYHNAGSDPSGTGSISDRRKTREGE